MPRGRRLRAAALAAAVLFATAFARAAGESAADGIGYPSIEAAFRALKADPAASVGVEGDWMVFTQGAGSALRTTWRFTRPGHPAHPSVVRRTEDDTRGEASTAVLCQSPDSHACAGLSR